MQVVARVAPGMPGIVFLFKSLLIVAHTSSGVIEEVAVKLNDPSVSAVTVEGAEMVPLKEFGLHQRGTSGEFGFVDEVCGKGVGVAEGAAVAVGLSVVVDARGSALKRW